MSFGGRSLLIGFFFLLCLQAARAAEESKCLPYFYRLKFADTSNPALQFNTFLLSNAISRLHRTQKEGAYARIEDAIAKFTPEQKRQVVQLKAAEDGLELDLEIKSLEDGIELAIWRLGAVEQKEKTLFGRVKRVKRVTTPKGQRNSGLNLAFPRFLVALAAGLDRHLATNPQLKTLRIRGLSVQNQHLVDQLKAFGFQSSQEPLSKFKRVVYPRAPALMVIAQAIGMGLHAFSNLSFTPIFIGQLVSGSWKGSKMLDARTRDSELGYDWKLDLELESPATSLPPAAVEKNK